MANLFYHVVLFSSAGTCAFLLLLVLYKLAGRYLKKGWIYKGYIFLLTLFVVPYWKVIDPALLGLKKSKGSAFFSGTKFSPETKDFLDITGGHSAEAFSFGYLTPEAERVTGILDSVQKMGVIDFAPYIWLAIFLILLLRLLLRYKDQTEFLLKSSIRMSSLDAVLEKSVREMGIKTPVAVCMNPKIKTPVLAGLMKFRIVLPNITLNEQELQMVVRHELTHLLRRDNWILLFAYLICCIHWFNPFIYTLLKALECSCEASCDEQVASEMGLDERKIYSLAVLNVISQINSLERLGGMENMKGMSAFCKGRKRLKQRMEDIVNAKTRQKKRVTVIAVLLTAAVFFSGGLLARAFDQPAADFDLQEAQEAVEAASAYYLKPLKASDYQLFDSVGDRQLKYRQAGYSTEGRAVTTMFAVTPEGEKEVCSFHTDGFDGFLDLNADSGLYESSGSLYYISSFWCKAWEGDQYESYDYPYPEEWELFFEKPPKVTNIPTKNGTADDELTLASGESAVYFSDDGKAWKLKKGDTVEMKILAHVWSNWPSRGEMFVGYNVDGSKCDLMENRNVISHFNIEDDKEAVITFQAPQNGSYSFNIENYASEDYTLKNVAVKVRE